MLNYKLKLLKQCYSIYDTILISIQKLKLYTSTYSAYKYKTYIQALGIR